MALFQKADPSTKVLRDLELRLAAKRTARDKIAAQLGAVQAKIAEHRDHARALVTDDGDEAALLGAENAMRAAQDRAASLAAGLGDVDKLIGELQSEIEIVVDRQTRVATSKEIETMVGRWQTATDAFVSAAAELLEVSNETTPTIYEAHGTSVFLETAVSQVPPAIDIIVGALRAHGQAVLDGGAAAALRRPDPPAPQLKLVEPSLTQIFSLNALQWTDHNGQLQRAGKWLDVELPPQAAERALRFGKAASLSYPRRFELRGHGGGHPDKSWCFDCDHEPVPESNAEPVVHSAFEKPTIGKPYNVTHSEPSMVPMAAARSITPSTPEDR